MLRFSVNKSEIAKKISIASSSIGSRTVDPILQCLLFKPTDGHISIYGTDLQTSVISLVRVGEYEGNESFAVDAELIDDIVSNQSEEEVIFEYSNGKLLVKSGKAKYNISTISDIERFPIIEIDNGGIRFSIDTSILEEMLERVSFCASSESAMRALNGVYWEVHGGFLRLVASDGYRLALAEQKLDIDSEFDFILALKSVKELEKLVSSTTEPTINIVYDHSIVSFSAGDVTMVVRTVEETFPDYKRVLPKAFKTRVVLNSDDFSEALKRVMIISKRGNEKVQLKITDDVMELSSQSPDFGEAIENIPVTKDGEDLIVNFNPKFLSEAVKHIGEKEIEFNFVDNINPLQINPRNVEGYIYIVLPVRA
ncbi:MAG: DNA polymerase III subunit beta [Fervidobacterium sp.]|uniref:DNA polymerase III subunit beta n=1 Tax=Fervidobacterium TaxID=2422 RepID=UPI0030B21821